MVTKEYSTIKLLRRGQLMGKINLLSFILVQIYFHVKLITDTTQPFTCSLMIAVNEN